MAIVNTYYMKKAEHRITYKSGRRNTQVDYILCRRRDLKEVEDCKVVVGESVAQQHRMVVCKLSMRAVKKKRGGGTEVKVVETEGVSLLGGVQRGAPNLVELILLITDVKLLLNLRMVIALIQLLDAKIYIDCKNLNHNILDTLLY